MKQYCECDIPIAPLTRSHRLRPTTNCPVHKTLAERWDSIKSRPEFYEALKADNPDIEDFDVWMKKN